MSGPLWPDIPKGFHVRRTVGTSGRVLQGPGGFYAQRRGSPGTRGPFKSYQDAERAAR